MLSLFSLVGLPQASTVAKNFDVLFGFIFWVCLICFIIIVGLTAFFVLRYRRVDEQSDKKTPYITGYTPLEIGVSVILFVLVMIMFVWGWVDYRRILRAHPSEETLEINVIAKQWLWDFWYLNGRHETNELVVPKGQKIKLLMSSADVIHSFYVPDFRLKQDVVPGTYTTLWFEANQTGEFQALCAEYCGSAHSSMLAKVKVVEPEVYEKWQSDWQVAKTAIPIQKEAAGLSEEGKKLFTAKGCNACHSVTGQKLIGPPLNRFGQETELADGSKAAIDENYLRESIMDPQSKMVKGYPPVMPTFRGVLTDEEVNALIAYIKGLK